MPLPYRIDLSLSGFVLRIESDLPIHAAPKFLPFLTKSTAPDLIGRIERTDHLPELSDDIIHEDLCYRVHADGLGGFLRSFFDAPRDLTPYAVTTWDQDARVIRVCYLSKGSHCFSELDSTLFHLGLERLLLQQERLCLHAACVRTDDGGVLFSGPSGIGKSTLLKLLLGLYRPQSGTLNIDTKSGSVPVNRSMRGMFSYAPQGNFLLSGTIRENLTFTNPSATEEEIRDALHASALDEYVATLPLGLETVLMENGAGLSEGQAQRLSLARAIVSGAPVLLLDEVTSALDAATEKTVLERIAALPGKTCIAVTHRPAALELADHIIEVTDQGMTIRSCE